MVIQILARSYNHLRLYQTIEKKIEKILFANSVLNAFPTMSLTIQVFPQMNDECIVGKGPMDKTLVNSFSHFK